MHRRLWASGPLLLLIFFVCVLFPRPAQAIPAFARKYETSCQTCHVAFPKLTPFGEAFRLNGLRFPEGGDATAEKVEPLSLGNAAQADRWPKVVYPGAIPASFPASLVLSGTLGYGTAFESHEHGAHDEMEDMEVTEEEHDHSYMLDASTLVDMFGLRVAGTLGDHVAVFGAVNLGGHAVVEVERASVLFTPFQRPTDLRIKVGAFEPELHGVSIHRGLTGHMLRLTTSMVGEDSFMPEPSKTGLEVSGVAAHRVGWYVGGVENATPDVYVAKDVYGRASWKIGGMPLDGSGGVSSTAAWRERAITLGASGWNGRAQIVTTDVTQDDTFTRIGADTHVIFDDVSLDLVAARQWNTSPHAGDVANAVTDFGYAELTWVVLPVVFPTVRAEVSRTGEASPEGYSPWLVLGVLNGVVRPNVLLRATAGFGADEADHTQLRFVTLAYATAL